MNSYIPVLPGEVKTPDDKYTNILELLGINGVEPFDVVNDGRSDPPIAALRIGDKQYALADVLKAIGNATGNTLAVQIKKPNAYYTTSKPFAEMAAADNLAITWEGRAATDMAYTKSGGKVTAITARFLTFGEGTLTVTAFEITSSGVTKTETEYELTAVEPAET